MSIEQIQVCKYNHDVFIKYGKDISHKFIALMQKWEGGPVLNCYYDKDVLDMKLKEALE